MLTNEQTLQLVAQAQQGDDNAKERLIVENMPLIKSVIKRYRNKGVESDDLYQLGSMGFVKAINNFSVEYEYKKTLKAPLKKDEKVGVVKVFDKNDLIFEENLYIMEEVKSKSISDKIKNIIKKW